MSYWTTALMAQDNDLTQREAAAAASEAIPAGTNPMQWALDHGLALAAQPGWDAAWSSALATNPPNPAPGRDEAVITDGMILAGVQAVLGSQTSE